MNYRAGLVRVLALIGLLVGILFTVPASASQDTFLDPEKAFILDVQMANTDTVRLRFKIAKGYYMYRERFAFKLDTERLSLGEPRFPVGEIKYDPTFDKKMELYFKEAVIFLPISAWPKTSPPEPFVLTVTGQGCAVAGICYPPMDFVLNIGPSPTGSGYVVEYQTQPLSALDQLKQGQWSELLFGGDDLRLADVLSSTGAIEIVLLFFLLGLLLALTPCVLPMLPILSVLLVGQGQTVSRSRGFILAVGYVLGMSVVYTALGIAAGLSGVGLAAWLQAPWVLATFALLLACLSLAMFDVYTLQMPSSIQTRLMAGNARLLGGRFGAALLMGALSALIVGPCVAAPLAGALLYISQTGDVILGGSALFAMAWGMGVPLLLMGASAGKLMPRAGPWMEGVKKFFGVLLLGTAWWMLTPMLASSVQIFGWAVLTMFSAVLLQTFEPLPQASGMRGLLRKTLGLLLVVLSVVWLLGIASGGRSLFQPLSHLSVSTKNTAVEPTQTVSGAQQLLGAPSLSEGSVLGRAKGSTAASLVGPKIGTTTKSTPTATTAASLTEGGLPKFQRVYNLTELERMLAQATRPVMLDFYADWCVSCKEMEAFTFTDPRVSERMSQMLLLKADVTANNADDRALMKRFRLFGPPGIIFFNAEGQERKDVRVVGFQEASRFAATLGRVLSE